MQIAALHTGFNLFLSAFCLPLVPLFDRLIHAIVKPRKETRLRFHTQYLHEKVLPIPELALSQAQREISRSANIVVHMVDESLECIRRYDSTRRLRIIDRDDEIDFLHDAIMGFLTRISREDLGPDDAKRISMLIMVITDIEHIGDIVSKSIVELANKIDQSPVPLSDEGKQELLEFFSTSVARLRETLTAFSLQDRDRALKVIEGRPESKARFSSYVDFHMNRLYKHKVESLQTTSIHIDLLEEVNRINHFTFRIAGHIINP
jgi:phosphate:Na+ symporter